MSDGYEGVREMGRAINDLVLLGVSVLKAGRGRYARVKARQSERRARHEAEAQRREWRELVERQKVRGEAGNTSYEEAAEALRGAGGRPNPLDQRKF